jgi:hypothetical protein
MTTSKALATQWSVWGVLGLAVTAMLCSPALLTAQKGENAVYNSSSAVAGSTAFIDASAFCGTTGSGACGVAGTDACTMIATALSTYYPSTPAGLVVDARGVVPPSGGSQPCSGNPFANITQTNTVPITVLLPASTINITAAWILPNNTRLVGEGGFTLLQGVNGTTVSCCTGAMIEMGPAPGQGQSCPSTPYSGISIEHLKLTNSNAGSYDGIDNECSQASSYVNDVGITNMTGTGLKIGSGAANSGPYTNLAFVAVTGQSCSGGSSPCVDIEAQTRGLHGVTCLGDQQTSTTQQSAGILVNASNNSIEDVHVESFWDGIEIGDTTQTVSNVFVSNINAGVSANCSGQREGEVTNVVHICGPYHQNPNPFGTCSTYGPVSDIAILQAANEGPSTTQVPLTSIQDDTTETIGTSISGCNAGTQGCGVATTAIYALGEQDGGNTGEYSRFVTNPASSQTYGSSSTIVPTWGVGNNNGSPPSGLCYTPGALYSYTAATNGSDSVYLCYFSNGSFSWTPIP